MCTGSVIAQAEKVLTTPCVATCVMDASKAFVVPAETKEIVDDSIRDVFERGFDGKAGSSMWELLGV